MRYIERKEVPRRKDEEKGIQGKKTLILLRDSRKSEKKAICVKAREIKENFIFFSIFYSIIPCSLLLFDMLT